jgi:hypothetical protein
MYPLKNPTKEQHMEQNKAKTILKCIMLEILTSLKIIKNQSIEQNKGQYIHNKT